MVLSKVRLPSRSPSRRSPKAKPKAAGKAKRAGVAQAKPKAKAKQQPSKAKKAPAELKQSKNNVYSRVYHASKRAGKGKQEAPADAREAAAAVAGA